LPIFLFVGRLAGWRWIAAASAYQKCRRPKCRVYVAKRTATATDSAPVTRFTAIRRTKERTVDPAFFDGSVEILDDIPLAQKLFLNRAIEKITWRVQLAAHPFDGVPRAFKSVNRFQLIFIYIDAGGFAG
jgi:hypothetical protein